MNNTFVIGGLIILAGTLLFWELVKRITPFDKYKFTHPIKLTGFISIIAVVLVHFFIIDLI